MRWMRFRMSRMVLHLCKGYYDLARLHTINAIGSYFVIRQKSHLKYEVIDGEELLDGADNVLLDQTIRLTGYQTREKYPSLLRRIVYYAPDLKRTFTFLTNNISIKAKDIAMLYKQRWQGELFFRLNAASPHHVLLGQYGERCEDTNLCCGYHILSRGYHQT